MTTPYTPIPMVPGPTTLHPDVLAALSQDFGSGDIEAAFLPFYWETGRTLAELMGTAGDVVLMTGEGMLALWAGLKSCLKPGDAVVCVGTGLFGNSIAGMAASLGCKVELLALPEDSTIGNGDSLQRIERTLRRVRPVMLTAVHCETPSGTLNPLAELGKLKQNLGIPLFYVDAVASIGGVAVQQDAWGIDVLLGGSQKCLAAPPSMSILGVSEAAWDVIAAVNYQGYDALLPFRNILRDGPPYTPYWHGLAALKAAAETILREGLKNCHARHEHVAALCRQGLQELGIKLFPDAQAVPSPTVTAALVPDGIRWEEWNRRLRERGLAPGGNYGALAGKVFRLGHMGTQADERLMRKALIVLEDALKKG